MVISVIRGGSSLHADVSIKSGAAVLAALNPERYEKRDIFISPEGYWRREGMSLSPERALRGADLVINCIPGRYGQDGWLHQLIVKMGHRVLGSQPGPLALSFNREKAKLIALRLGMQAPAHRCISREDDRDAALLNIFRSLAIPVTVQPIGGSFLHEASLIVDLPVLRDAVASVLAREQKALVEEQVSGDAVSVLIVEEFRDESRYAIVSGSAPSGEAALVAEAARQMHHYLGLSHFSQSDFIINSRGLWYRHTNALPPFHEKSPFVRGLASREITLPDFLDHVIASVPR